MRVLGCQGDDLAHAWSKNGTAHSPEVLSDHLKKIIKEEKKRKVAGPPSARAPKRKESPTPGTLAPDVIPMDEDQFFEKQTTEEKAVQECETREDAGLEDIVESVQPTRMPNVNQSLVGKWLEICVEYLTQDGPINRWCTGTVTIVSNGKIHQKEDHTTKHEQQQNSCLMQ